MPTLEWLKREFSYGYDSGDVLSLVPNLRRLKEERAIGGSYRQVFLQALTPHLKPTSKVLELGPGKGSWTRAILRYVPQGEVQTLDFQDVTSWIKPEQYHGRLRCHQVFDNSFQQVPDDYFDCFWSFGVLCHNNSDNIFEILRNSLAKLKQGGVSIHQYGDWEKLEAYGWQKGRVPIEFKDLSDSEIWWPRNSQATMVDLATRAGWQVVCADLGLLKRDSILVLRKG